MHDNHLEPPVHDGMSDFDHDTLFLEDTPQPQLDA
jgi:hypothetical protein